MVRPCSSVRIGIGTRLSAKPIRCSSRALTITVIPAQVVSLHPNRKRPSAAHACRRASSLCSTSAYAALLSAIFCNGYSVPINALYTMDNTIGVVVADGGTNVCRRDSHFLSRCGYGFCSSDAGRFAADGRQNDSAL